jgi:hypothetical protein
VWGAGHTAWQISPGPISENRRPPSIITAVRVDRILQLLLISHEVGTLAAQIPKSGIHKGGCHPIQKSNVNFITRMVTALGMSVSQNQINSYLHYPPRSIIPQYILVSSLLSLQVPFDIISPALSRSPTTCPRPSVILHLEVRQIESEDMYSR